MALRLEARSHGLRLGSRSYAARNGLKAGLSYDKIGELLAQGEGEAYR
ncbi:MAG: hypothetical protein NTW21_08530 [Verrucomicrobia bacterium]|nr:hypothetical protein [Verrucomicrobiota bacterium]